MARGWVYTDSWYYYDYNGNKLTGWQNINNKWYFLDESNGAMKIGWHKDSDGEWYYLNNDGSMASGWIKDNGKDYLLYSNGTMAHDCMLYGYAFGSDGAATKINTAEVSSSSFKVGGTAKTSNIEFWVFHENEVYQFPVNPDEVSISRSNDNQSVKVYKTGNLVFWGPPNLKSISFSSFFPNPEAGNKYICSYGDPWDTVSMFERWSSDGKPTRLMITNTNINMYCLIDKFDTKLSGGIGDVDFTLTFTEYKQLTLNNGSNNTSNSTSSTNSASSSSSTQQSNNTSTPSCNTGEKHLVQENESLWLISRKYYGDGSKWETIYNANKSIISNPNLIYPGQVLTIPQ